MNRFWRRSCGDAMHRLIMKVPVEVVAMATTSTGTFSLERTSEAITRSLSLTEPMNVPPLPGAYVGPPGAGAE